MALAYSNITVELKEIFLSNRPKELYEISPKGTVPVLNLNDSKIIDESLDIMQWSLKQNDPENWLKPSLDNQLKLVNKNDEEFKYWLDRYKYFERYPEHDKNYYRAKCDKFISKIDSNLKNHSYIFSPDLSFADVAIFPFIRQFANVDYFWFYATYKNVTLWLTNFTESQLFNSVMKKYNEYKIGQNPFIVNFKSM